MRKSYNQWQKEKDKQSKRSLKIAWQKASGKWAIVRHWILRLFLCFLLMGIYFLSTC